MLQDCRGLLLLEEGIVTGHGYALSDSCRDEAYDTETSPPGAMVTAPDARMLRCTCARTFFEEDSAPSVDPCGYRLKPLVKLAVLNWSSKRGGARRRHSRDRGDSHPTRSRAVRVLRRGWPRAVLPRAVPQHVADLGKIDVRASLPCVEQLLVRLVPPASLSQRSVPRPRYDPTHGEQPRAFSVGVLAKAARIEQKW